MSSRNFFASTLLLSAFGFAACEGNASKTAAPSETAQAKSEPISTPKAETPKVEKPKLDPPKVEPPKVDPPKVETPKVDPPKVEPPKAEPPKPTPSGDAAIDTMRAFIATLKIDKSVAGWKTKVTMPPKLTFEAGRKYFWTLNTSEGAIKMRLMPDVAPMHVSSTIYLTELGFYDDLTFHRVIPGFMAQGGDPLGNGGGGPAYKYGGEFAANALHSKPGILAMAHAGPNTDGSQFYITLGPQPGLDGRHTVFGEVVEGLESLKKLETFGSPGGPTTKPLKIVSAKITNE